MDTYLGGYMNYPKLFLSVLLLTGLTANYAFGMQKPGSDSDFQNKVKLLV